MVLFKVSAGTLESGVQVGNYFFQSWPVKESLPETRLCLFAFPYDVDAKTPAAATATPQIKNSRARISHRRAGAVFSGCNVKGDSHVNRSLR